MKKNIFTLLVIICFICCGCSNTAGVQNGYKDDKKIAEFKEKHKYEIINIDDYYQTVQNGNQEDLDNDCIITIGDEFSDIYDNYGKIFYCSYYHHNTTDFLTLVFSIDEGDEFILDGKKWIMGPMSLGNVNDEETLFYDENNQIYQDVYYNPYIITCNFDVEGYNRYFFRINRVINKSDFKRDVLDFDEFFYLSKNEEDRHVILQTNRTGKTILDIMEDGDLFSINGETYRFKEAVEVCFVELEDKPGYGHYYDVDDNIVKYDDYDITLFYYYEGDNYKLIFIKAEKL